MWSKCLNTGPQPPHPCDGDASSIDFVRFPEAAREALRTEPGTDSARGTRCPSLSFTVVTVVILTIPKGHL